MISQKKQFLFGNFIFLLLLLCQVACTVNYWESQVPVDNKIYFVPGKAGQKIKYDMLEHCDFDALILGSSLSTNFLCTDFDRFFQTNSLKLAESGTTLANAMEFTSYALRKNKKIKFVLNDLMPTSGINSQDILTINAPDQLQSSLEKYISFESLRKSVIFLWQKETSLVSRDDYGIWYDNPKYEYPVAIYASYVQTHDRPTANCEVTEESTNLLKQALEHDVIPIVKNYPDTFFIFYFPPFSLLSWEKMDIECLIEGKATISHELLKYPNVLLFDFQNAVEVTANLDNYADYNHYMEHINLWMIEQMAQGKYRLLPSNLDQVLADFRQTLSTHDFDKDRRYLNSIFENLSSKDRK